MAMLNTSRLSGRAMPHPALREATSMRTACAAITTTRYKWVLEFVLRMKQVTVDLEMEVGLHRAQRADNQEHSPRGVHALCADMSNVS